MKISINGSPADITLETEKTIGDILSGMDKWLEGSGGRLSGLLIDGRKIGPAALGEAFGLSLDGIGSLDIAVSSWRELAAEALLGLGEICGAWGSLPFESRGEARKNWEESAAAAFLAAEIPDIYGFAARSFSGEGLSPEDLGSLVTERLRELEDPGEEISRAGGLVSSVAGRLEDLPLDIQTGKDGRAAETMQLFSRTAEKLFRLLFILKTSGLPPETLIIDNRSAKDFMAEFNSALKELSSAYENRDAVLVGDLAEYELAPRLIKFFTALKDSAGRVPTEVL
jgi:hypothetical protein